MVDEHGLKVFSCLFWLDLLCSYRKDAGHSVMSRCERCRHYRRFMREMGEEDDRVMNEIDEIRRTGVWK